MLCLAFAVGGCGGAPILANEPIVFPSPARATKPPPRPLDPIAIELPRDDGPHDRLTEWWYYTGHLRSLADGRRFGFEAVVFRAERGGVPIAWASHLALTDEQGNAFHYAQRSEIGSQVDHSPRDAASVPTGFDLQVSGLNPDLIAAGAPPLAAPWQLAGSGGTDRIRAGLAAEEATAAGADFGLTLDLRALKPPALHNGDGFVDFGPAGSSYYYSRTRLGAVGQVTLDGQTLQVEGIAWFDHQWGDFIGVGAGGWNWFAISLDDGTDITVSQVLDERSNIVLTYGTLVAKDGTVRHLTEGEILARATTTNFWLSPHTGLNWAGNWEVDIDTYVLRLRPTVADQELDTRATTGVVYWEGSQVVTDQSAGSTVGGEAYVEITRYDATRT